LEKMELKDIGALMVIDSGKLVGMFSERDYARKILKQGCIPAGKVSDFMSSKVIVVNPGTSINECMAIMTQKHVRHLPVLDHNELCGLISIGDVVNSVIQEQFSTIKDLEKYITGGYGTE